MGEEGAPGGTVRYASTLLRCRGRQRPPYSTMRYVVTANGEGALPRSRPAPLRRGRALQGLGHDQRCLHPTLPCILFGLLTSWTRMNKGLGGWYHAASNSTERDSRSTRTRQIAAVVALCPNGARQSGFGGAGNGQSRASVHA